MIVTLAITTNECHVFPYSLKRSLNFFEICIDKGNLTSKGHGQSVMKIL